MEIRGKTLKTMEILNSVSDVAGNQLGQITAHLLSRRDFLHISKKATEVFATTKGIGVAKEIGKEIIQQISPDQETVGFFANYPVGEAKTGQIFALERVLNAFPQDSFALYGIALEKITPENEKKIDIKILKMKGLDESAEIGIAYEENPLTQTPNGRSWLVLSYADVKDESGNIIKGVLKPLNKGLVGGATTFSLEMGIIDNSKEHGEIVMGPIDEAGGVTPVFVFDVKVNTDEDSNDSIEYNGVSFIPFFTDTLQSGPIEAPKTIIKHAENARARIKVESPAPALPAEAVKSAQKYFGENFEITPDGKVIDKNLGTEIPGFTIVPFDENRMINRGSRTQEPPTWALQRVYEFEDQKDFTVYLTEYDLKREDTKIIGYGWVYENGEFTRKQVEFNTQNPNRKVYIEGYSPEEIQYMIIRNNSDNPSYSHDGYKAYQDLTSIIPVSVVDKALFITYEGMWEPMDYNITGWGHNIIPVNKDGKWELVATSEYGLFPEFKDRNKALIIWHDKNDKKVVYAVDGKYLDIPYMFNGYWKDNDPRNPFGS